MCFDYSMLKEKFDLNLESVSPDLANCREKDEEEQEKKHFDERREPRLLL